jgi:hypothetical protein
LAQNLGVSLGNCPNGAGIMTPAQNYFRDFCDRGSREGLSAKKVLILLDSIALFSFETA